MSSRWFSSSGPLPALHTKMPHKRGGGCHRACVPRMGMGMGMEQGDEAAAGPLAAARRLPCRIEKDRVWGMSYSVWCGVAWCGVVARVKEERGRVRACVRVFVQSNHRIPGLIGSGVLSGRTMVGLTGKESNLITTDTRTQNTHAPSPPVSLWHTRVLLDAVSIFRSHPDGASSKPQHTRGSRTSIDSEETKGRRRCWWRWCCCRRWPGAAVGGRAQTRGAGRQYPSLALLLVLLLAALLSSRDA